MQSLNGFLQKGIIVISSKKKTVKLCVTMLDVTSVIHSRSSFSFIWQRNIDNDKKRSKLTLKFKNVYIDSWTAFIQTFFLSCFIFELNIFQFLFEIFKRYWNVINLNVVYLKFHIECVHVASEEGDYSYKKVLGEEESSTTACGLYILTDPNKIVEISIKYLDANCDSGSLLAVNYTIINIYI